MGGSLGRREATGRGVFICAREAAKRAGVSIKGARVAIQGFGNVGSISGKMFADAGAKVVAIQDHETSIFNSEGINIAAAQAYCNSHKSLAGFEGATHISTADFWLVESEFLVPAALESQITDERARNLSTKFVVEGANGPTIPTADLILRDRKITVVPDVLANAGGVTVSYFEWVQDFSSFFWTEEEINARLEKIMVGAFDAVYKHSQEKQLTLRESTFVIACIRVLDARNQRGIYP